MTNHAVYPKLIILSYWNTPSRGLFMERVMRLAANLPFRQIVMWRRAPTQRPTCPRHVGFILILNKTIQLFAKLCYNISG